MCLLLLVAAGAGWWSWHETCGPAPRFHYMMLSINQEPRRVLAAETLSLHPRDRVKILEISTNVPFNLDVRVACEGFDAGSLRYDESRISDLLPAGEAFEHYRFRIWVKHRNEALGYTDWEVRPFAEDWLDKADRTIDEKRRLALLQRAHRLLPDEGTISRRLLDEYKSLKKWKQAAAMLEKRAGQSPDRGILEELLTVYDAMNSDEGRINVLKRMVLVKPDDLDARYQLAEIYERTGRLKQAIRENEAILKRTEKGSRGPIYKLLGYLYTKTGDFKKAISAYLEAAQLDREDANVFYNLSFLYEKTGDKGRADQYLDRAVMLKSEDVEGRLKLARRLILKGDLKRAEKYLSEILAKSPDSLKALLLMSQLLEKKGDRKRLRKAYEKILALDSENLTVVHNMGTLEYEADNLKASLKYLKRYSASHPKDATVHEILFDIYKRLGNPSMAFKEAGILVRIDPQKVDLYHYMFEYLKKQGDNEGIIKLMESGVKANPRKTEIREYLVLAYLESGRDKKAMDQMEKILDARPDDTGLLLNLARLKEKHGRLAEALDAYKRVMELLPDHEEAGDAYLRLRLKGVRREGAGQ